MVGDVCGRERMHGRGVGMHGRGRAWQGACMAVACIMGGHAWQGACMVGGMCGGGHAWGCAWQEVCLTGMCLTGGRAWEAGGSCVPRMPPPPDTTRYGRFSFSVCLNERFFTV